MQTPESFLFNFDMLRTENESLKIQVTRDQERIKLLVDEASWLREQLLEFKRDRFGKKSERWETKEQGRGIGLISSLAWPGALRMLDRKSPGYDA